MTVRRVGVDPELEPDLPPRRLYREDLGGEDPIEGVNFWRVRGRELGVLRPKCHPESKPTLASYIDGAVRLRCSFCGMTVADLAIATKGAPHV